MEVSHEAGLNVGPRTGLSSERAGSATTEILTYSEAAISRGSASFDPG